MSYILGNNNPNFLFGVSTCTYQDSGYLTCMNSQWKNWEHKCLPEHNRSNNSANLFSLYSTNNGRHSITTRLHKLGINSYRFSIEWSLIEPKHGHFNYDNLFVYLNLCKHLRNQGIQPMVTLHHFSEPKWFHSLGSFEHEENIEYFENFSKFVFRYFVEPYNGKPLVEYFCTINEPNIETFQRSR